MLYPKVFKQKESCSIKTLLTCCQGMQSNDTSKGYLGVYTVLDFFRAVVYTAIKGDEGKLHTHILNLGSTCFCRAVLTILG